MEHFVTLFDSTYLPQALALHASMQRHVPAFRLWALCVDDQAHDLLTRLALPACTPMKLSALETPSLRTVKAQRSRGEYCWTLTPFAPRFVFEADPSVQRVTYVDADLCMRKDPAPLFAELEASGAQVLITDHGYAPEYDQSAKSGQYCVQFMTFSRHGGEPVRQWWEDRCIEWCYARFEDGKFGDQKYLDDWPSRFKGLVHVLRQQEWAQAPWNATRFPYSQAVFFHFHGLRIAPGRRFDLGTIYALPSATLQNVYEPYIADLKAAIAQLERLGFAARPQSQRLGLYKLLRRAFSGVYQQLWRFHQLNFRKY
ncbi:hypothetical protein [Piscinibacter sp. XHJ-5]|uniref:hypothetical protein n=1 Tax=Piscinibacter sp. XHJ-5 TaxID=3037797 RepID=UPI002452D9B5|nr:hypothetical protein [Piscinibacter sp. XHJ-5]